MKNCLTVVLSCTILYSCISQTIPPMKAPGYNYKLFENTPYEAMADAVSRDDIDAIIYEVKENKLDVNFQEPKFGTTLLIMAVFHDKMEVVKTLLELGADPNLQNNGKESPLTMACGTSTVPKPHLVKLMLEYGADPNAVQYDYEVREDGFQIKSLNRTVLMIAAEAGCLDCAKVLIKHGAELNKYTYYEGYSAITSAVIHNNMDIAKYLIIEAKAETSEYAFIRISDTLTLEQHLNQKDYSSPRHKENKKNRDEILKYLKKNK